MPQFIKYLRWYVIGLILTYLSFLYFDQEYLTPLYQMVTLPSESPQKIYFDCLTENEFFEKLKIYDKERNFINHYEFLAVGALHKQIYCRGKFSFIG